MTTSQTQSRELHSSVTAIIDCDALCHNFEQVRRLAPNSHIMAVVKANGYGHGILEVATILQQADSFGVARLSEAMQLRAGGILQPLVVLNGFYSVNELTLMSTNNIDSIVHSMEQVAILKEANLKSPISVWLKVDTGMHRVGLICQQAQQAYKCLCRCSNVKQPVVLMSHFSRADEVMVNDTSAQMTRFNAFATGKSSPQSLAASSGILLWPTSRREWVRPGIMLYGISPVSTETGAKAFDLRPVMTFKSRLLAVRDHKAGEPVGYGAIWRSSCDTRLGVVAVGYGDGYPRSAASGTPVLVNGRRVPLVGRVSMDSITVDLGLDSEDNVGDEVILWGEALPVEQVALHAGTISYELVTRLTARVERVYVNSRRGPKRFDVIDK